MTANVNPIKEGLAPLMMDITQKINAGLTVAIDAASCEEQMIIEQLFLTVASALNLVNDIYVWDTGYAKEGGFRQVRYEPKIGITIEACTLAGWEPSPPSTANALNFVRTCKKRALFIFIDSHKALEADPSIQRVLKTTADALYSNGDNALFKGLIFFGEAINLPADFKGRVDRVVVPLPSATEIKAEIELQMQILGPKYDAFRYPTASELADIVRSACGLTRKEIITIVRKVAGSHHRQIGPVTAQELHRYKVDKLQELGVEVANPPTTSIGGLRNLKTYLAERKSLLLNGDPDVPRIKGMLVVGPSGTGKSLTAKTIGHVLNAPVFRLTPDAMMGSLVGESERKTATILRIAAAAAPIVFWLDEVEKLFAGASSDAPSGDSGTSQRVFGQFLTFMQENTQPVYVVATANDVERLPAEFLRRGRFDEIFRVDLPTQSERTEIARIHLRRWAKALDIQAIDVLATAVANDSEGYSGAELESVVQDAAIRALSRDRKGQITQDDLLAILKTTEPLSVQQKDKIEAMQKRCAKFKPASDESKATESISLGREVAGISLPSSFSL